MVRVSSGQYQRPGTITPMSQRQGKLVDDAITAAPERMKKAALEVAQIQEVSHVRGRKRLCC